MRADNSRHIIAAARHRTDQARQRAIAALRRMDTTGKPVSFDSVARQAGVSRSWLYTQNDLRSQIERLRERGRPAGPPQVPDRQRASGDSLLRRLEAATSGIRQLRKENQELREALARSLGERRTADILGHTSRHDTPNKNPAKIIDPYLNHSSEAASNTPSTSHPCSSEP